MVNDELTWFSLIVVDLLRFQFYHVLYVSSMVSSLQLLHRKRSKLDPRGEDTTPAFDDKGGLRHSQRRQSHRRV